MSKLKVLCYGLSMDGFGAGPDQSLENPMGLGGMVLHEWVLATKTFREMHGKMMGGEVSGGTLGVDDDFAAKGFHNIGAWILGRNMFGPIRGPWSDDTWKGWWGDNPPYHTQVFVITHFERPSIEMAGGTSFHFITDGIESALQRAKEAAKGKDVRLGGGAETIRQYLRAKLIDEMHIAVTPNFLGSGEHLFRDINLPDLGYQTAEYIPSEKAIHIVLRKK